MPYQWVPSSVFMTYRGVNFYHVYRHDMGNEVRKYSYGWDPDCSEEEERAVFDVRDLAYTLGLPCPDSEAEIRAVLAAAVDRGLWTPSGPKVSSVCPQCGSPNGQPCVLYRSCIEPLVKLAIECPDCGHSWEQAWP